MDPLTTLGAALGSFALGFVKSKTTILDGKIGRAVKPLQPLLVTVAAVGLPFATNALHIAPVDPSVFVHAPTATLALITAREGLRRLRGK